MAGASSKVRKGWSEVSSVLGFEQNPRRRIAVLAVVALVVVALLVALVGSLHLGGGCNAALSVERYGCMAALAGRTGNALYCNQIGSPGIRESCITSVAMGSGNVSACSVFPEGPYRTGCIGNVSFISLDPSLCGGLDSYNQSLCVYRIASRLNFSRISYCTGMRNLTYDGICTAQSYYRLALQTGNYSYCARLPPATDSALLYAMGLQNPAFQSGSYGDLTSLVNTTPQDFCYASLANVTSGAACSRISSSTLRAACGESPSATNSTIPVQNATADCASGSTPQMNDLCYFSLYTNEAIETGNESWCGLIMNKSYMTSCIVNLAGITANTTYCNGLQGSNAVQSCIEETQMVNGNYT